MAQSLPDELFEGLDSTMAWVIKEELLKTGDNVWPRFVGRGRSSETIPAISDTFAALRDPPPFGWKVVIMGQDPYPRRESACGVAFCDAAQTSWDRPMAPSLRNIIKNALMSFASLSRQANVAEVRRVIRERDVLAPPEWFASLRAQGVLWLNTALTFTSTDVAHLRKHTTFWKPIVRSILNHVVRTSGNTGLVFVWWGSYAKKMYDVIDFGDSTKVGHVSAHHPAVETFHNVETFHLVNRSLGCFDCPPIDFLPTDSSLPPALFFKPSSSSSSPKAKGEAKKKLSNRQEKKKKKNMTLVSSQYLQIKHYKSGKPPPPTNCGSVSSVNRVDIATFVEIKGLKDKTGGDIVGHHIGFIDQLHSAEEQRFTHLKENGWRPPAASALPFGGTLAPSSATSNSTTPTKTTARNTTATSATTKKTASPKFEPPTNPASSSQGEVLKKVRAGVWRCMLCPKHFKARLFVERHIRKFHPSDAHRLGGNDDSTSPALPASVTSTRTPTLDSVESGRESPVAGGAGAVTASVSTIHTHSVLDLRPLRDVAVTGLAQIDELIGYSADDPNCGYGPQEDATTLLLFLGELKRRGALDPHTHAQAKDVVLSNTPSVAGVSAISAVHELYLYDHDAHEAADTVSRIVLQAVLTGRKRSTTTSAYRSDGSRDDVNALERAYAEALRRGGLA